MSKIGIIIQREFNTRVRKRSFIVMTIVTPLLLAALMVAPTLVMLYSKADTKTIAVVDHSGFVASQLENGKDLAFKIEAPDASVEELKKNAEGIFGVMVVGDVLKNPSDVQIYAHGNITMDIEGGVTDRLERIIENEKLKAYNIDSLQQILSEVKTNVVLSAYKISDTGEEKESSSVLSMGAAYGFGFLIYMFVFLYGAMVLNGVIEEKSSKVLEVMVSSVRPYELMMGKILGIALVALLQFVIWVVFMIVVGMLVLNLFMGDALKAAAEAAAAGMPVAMQGVNPNQIAFVNAIRDVGFLAEVIGAFILFFVGGYLLYASMFAAVGSAVDNAADTQQLQLPLTLPLILAIVVLMSVFNNPDGPLAFWFSMIPFTSPVIMMARIPYGVPWWQVVLSAAILYTTFYFMVKFAGKIYRVGIFMYGKKPTWAELFKWMNYKY